MRGLPVAAVLAVVVTGIGLAVAPSTDELYDELANKLDAQVHISRPSITLLGAPAGGNGADEMVDNGEMINNGGGGGAGGHDPHDHHHPAFCPLEWSPGVHGDEAGGAPAFFDIK